MVIKFPVFRLQFFVNSIKGVATTPPGNNSGYGTWVLSRISSLSAARIQPVLEVDKVILNEPLITESIEKRKLDNKPDVKKVAKLFELAKQMKENVRIAERNREANTDKMQSLLQMVKDNVAQPSVIKNMRETGKKLRQELKTANQKFQEVNDELVELILSLPNFVDAATPDLESQLVREVIPPEGVELWKYPANLQWERIPSAGPYMEFPTGSAVYLEMDLASRCQKFLLENGFCETGNVDFVKRVLLDGPGLDPEQFLRIHETRAKASGVAHASYLVGGATFPAFLALFAQSMLKDESMFPIRYFVIGRMYSKNKDGKGANQTCAVQVFVACRDYVEQESEYHRLTNLMEKFYAEKIGISFQTRYLPAHYLRTYETKKTAFVVPERNLVVGDLSAAGEYVSKRLLCCYADTQRAPKFMSLITGKFLYITDFIRPLGMDTDCDDIDAIAAAAAKRQTDEGFLLPPTYIGAKTEPKAKPKPPVNSIPESGTIDVSEADLDEPDPDDKDGTDKKK